jgi:hypothetical protein
VPALRSPDAEAELEPEKEDVNTPNIAVAITVQLGFGTRDRLTDSDTQLGSTLKLPWRKLTSPHTHISSHTLHTIYLHDEG